MADRLLELGIYVVGFSYPVVPKGLARIRTQMSAALEMHHFDKALAAFETVGSEFSIITRYDMKSLVKAKREPGIWMHDVPVPNAALMMF